MAELDLIEVVNPTSEDFTVNHNGEPYVIKAGEKKQFVHFVSRHIAKHLSDKMLNDEFNIEAEKAKKKKEPLSETLQNQRVMLDNPQRRIALYTILESKEEVERVVKSYAQFKQQDGRNNFVGEISIYDEFVEKYNQPKEEPKEEPMKVGRPLKVD